jgi:hypothetical protein
VTFKLRFERLAEKLSAQEGGHAPALSDHSIKTFFQNFLTGASMRNKIPLITLVFAGLMASPIQAQQSLDSMIDRNIASLVATYKMLHAAPELSHQELKTSTFFAAQLRTMGYEVSERIGKYENPALTSYGVVAILKNGPGPVVLIRTELDALPVNEKTGLPYASTVKTKNDAGDEVSVMHACGHDIHITSMLGTAKMLSELKNQWGGTLIILGQPAEETVDGARAMMRDGLYQKFAKPDFVVALHDNSNLEAGKVGYTPGYSRQRRFCGHKNSWRGRTWCGSGNDKRSNCGGRRNSFGAANNREQGKLSIGSGSNHCRLHSWRQQTQHHPR